MSSANLNRAAQFHEFVVEQTTDMIFWVNERMQIQFANSAACRNLGYTKSEFSRMEWRHIDPHCDGEVHAENWRNHPEEPPVAVESWFMSKSGNMFQAETRWTGMVADSETWFCCISRDISHRVRFEGELAYQAQHDQLTGLANRRLFDTRMRRAIEASRKAGRGLAILYIDLDGFKFINDTMGHSAGDVLLRKVAVRLRGCVRGRDMIARMGGDEFTLIAEDIDDPQLAISLAERLQSGLQASFLVNGTQLTVSASVGISLFPRDGSDGHDLLRSADSAMYEAKRQGRNRWSLFTPELQTAARERLELEMHLRYAVERGEFVVLYQPEVALKDGRTVRYEALLQWNSQALGTIQPTRFIPIAEETGMIVEIGRWVLEEACRCTCLDQKNTGTDSGVSVNVSPVQFLQPDFVATVIEVLQRTGLEPRFLELELTEMLMVQRVEEVAARIQQLRDVGVSVAIDDFGTGYSSLSYLRKLPVSAIKIDNSFVRDLTTDSNAQSLVRAINSLAGSLGMRVVVEGIENAEQLQAVREIGCAEAQGHFIGRPEPERIPAQGLGPVRNTLFGDGSDAESSEPALSGNSQGY